MVDVYQSGVRRLQWSQETRERGIMTEAGPCSIIAEQSSLAEMMRNQQGWRNFTFEDIEIFAKKMKICLNKLL